jgi:hypothetical protein
MEPVWRGLLTCDYEHTRPAATRLEWDLYTTSLTRWPHTLMDEPSPYGRLRRPGIVDIPEADHNRLLTRWHQLLGDPDYVTDLDRRSTTWAVAVSAALTEATRQPRAARGAATHAALADATRNLLALNATHIVNWLLPEQPWEDLLTTLFGSVDKARACVFALMTPTSPGHLLDARRTVLSVAGHLRDGGNVQQLAAVFAATAGPVHGATSPGRTALPLEDPASAAALLRQTAAGQPDAELAAIAEARAQVSARRDTWRSAAVLAAAGNPRHVRAVRAIALACQWSANCEERRKELRHRYLAAVRRWCANTDRDPARLTADDLLAGGTP